MKERKKKKKDLPTVRSLCSTIHSLTDSILLLASAIFTTQILFFKLSASFECMRKLRTSVKEKNKAIYRADMACPLLVDGKK